MTQSTTRKRAMLLAAMISVLALLIGVMPAAASTGSGAVAGSGTISPGLTTTPTNQSVTFTGRGAIVSDSGNGAIFCSFSGSSTIAETVAQGQGSGNLNCSGEPGSATCSVSYSRTGWPVMAVTVSGSCSGTISGSLEAACSFQPTSMNPMTSYQLQCSFAIS